MAHTGAVHIQRADERNVSTRLGERNRITQQDPGAIVIAFVNGLPLQSGDLSAATMMLGVVYYSINEGRLFRLLRCRRCRHS